MIPGSSWIRGLIAAAGLAFPAVVAHSSALSFQIEEGRNLNSFVREGRVAAHLLLRSGTHPRVLVAFPAGNSGVGLWFAKTEGPVAWTLVGSPRPVTGSDAKGRPLLGIEAEAIVTAPRLDIQKAVLSSVRLLRDYESLGVVTPEVLTEPTLADGRLVWSRDRLDGAPGYQLSVQVLDDSQLSAQTIESGSSGRLHLKISALTGEAPLTPIEPESLLTSTAAPDVRARDVLAFLSYEDKFLAGSWRFDTYFGRDTLMSLTLLGPVLQPLATESGIESVLARLAANGEVAHEEDIGEFAVLRNAKEGRGAIDTPIYDYGMIDDDFMLAPLAARWLLDSAEGHARAASFLGKRNANERNGESLVRNLHWVTERTARFAAEPKPANLVGIKAGRMTGQWRDSEEGLGRGRYAYDVNAVFVPAALSAVERLVRSGLLDPYLSVSQRRALLRAGGQSRVWSTKAPPLFVVTLPNADARRHIETYAAQIGVDARPALGALGENSLVFNALSLDAVGWPIPVLHSDDGFALLLGTPEVVELERTVKAVLRPFPAGLLTPAGLLVANPAFAGRDVQARFTNTAYHGTVVWSWQQAVLAAGLARQLARTDLPSALRARLVAVHSQLWGAIENASAVRTSELWSWSFSNGRYHVVPFGQRGADEDESNAAQLWSTVYLGVGSQTSVRPSTSPRTPAADSCRESSRCVRRYVLDPKASRPVSPAAVAY